MSNFTEIVHYWACNYYGITAEHTLMRIKTELLKINLVENEDYTNEDIINKLGEWINEK